MSKNIINVDSLNKYHQGLKVTYLDPLEKKVDDFESGDRFLNDLQALDAKIGENINGINNSLKTLDNKIDGKPNIKVELLDTLTCNNVFYNLKYHSDYPILQGGCFSDDGLNYYCCSITKGGGNEKGVIDKYSVGSVSDFSTWKHVATSNELNTSHGNDMTYLNGKLYLTNTNVKPTEIIVINPNSLIIEGTVNIKYGATAITYNKKLNQFITRRKNEWSTFDFYDVDFNYIKTSVAEGITFDVVQGIDSDDSYIYSPCSEPSFGNSVVVYDLDGNFIKRLGSNTMSEIEHITNHNGYYVAGFYKNGKNFLAISTLRTDKRMTGARYVLNQGRNTVLTGSDQVFNGIINLKFSRKYCSHLSFNITVDGVDVETKILDITDTQNTISRILNTFRLTGNGQAIFYRSLLVIRDNTLEITPVVYHTMNADGTRVVKTYANEPSAFTKSNSISISNVCGQILCGQRVSE